MPQSARLSAGGGSNGYLGNAQMNCYIFVLGLPLALLWVANLKSDSAVDGIHNSCDVFNQTSWSKNPSGYSFSFLALAFAFGVYLTLRSGFYNTMPLVSLELCLAMGENGYFNTGLKEADGLNQIHKVK